MSHLADLDPFTYAMQCTSEMLSHLCTYTHDVQAQLTVGAGLRGMLNPAQHSTVGAGLTCLCRGRHGNGSAHWPGLVHVGYASNQCGSNM